jgi:hypothetical protein
MEKVKVNTDGSIDFKTGESIPTTAKRFRQSPEIEAFYRFVYENDLREEALMVLNDIREQREEQKTLEKEKKKEAKKQARAASKSSPKAPAKNKAKTKSK